MTPTDREKAQEIVRTGRCDIEHGWMMYDRHELEDRIAAALSEARKDAIEECAMIADDMDYSPDGAIARSIRALKGTP